MTLRSLPGLGVVAGVADVSGEGAESVMLLDKLLLFLTMLAHDSFNRELTKDDTKIEIFTTRPQRLRRFENRRFPFEVFAALL